MCNFNGDSDGSHKLSLKIDCSFSGCRNMASAKEEHYQPGEFSVKI